MKNLICIQMLFLLVMLIPTGILSAETLATKLEIFSTKIKSAQVHFPQGDLADITYVKKIITQMYELDQEFRNAFIPQIANENTNILLSNLMASMDKFHTNKLQAILTLHGWITISKFGTAADHQAWLLVQHADHDPFFQAGCVFILSNLINIGETDKKNYAYLYDRVTTKFDNLGLKQKYGTQIELAGDRFAVSPHVGTLMELNQSRKEIGLDTIEEYLTTIKQLYKK